MEIAIRAEKQFRAKVAEVPIIFIERIYGESKLWSIETFLGILKIVQ
ncbi:hypothetical protein BEWA_026180 [Theileria equi strain WA]|uniref:Uncharacterized protein n=1 Tax=Theileria equi strain WA TaxID=1537102 RepID=L0AXX9_THEEQ|nr:hypothetical protein BEWA_026180 [Theileria equi strain WA]AFZ79769.1 hypothetical protein BEWA_026180 [Theileria equi strain WA]|eukprot:XP_004829435.1 hypothetical protein BEWA_026180 [Theileria equi strain WA]